MQVSTTLTEPKRKMVLVWLSLCWKPQFPFNCFWRLSCIKFVVFEGNSFGKKLMVFTSSWKMQISPAACRYAFFILPFFIMPFPCCSLLLLPKMGMDSTLSWTDCLCKIDEELLIYVTEQKRTSSIYQIAIYSKHFCCIWFWWYFNKTVILFYTCSRCMVRI